jgi:hypothetical protein
VAELKIQDINKETPVGTTLALLERSLKVMSAVQARIHAAMKTEFKLLAAIIAEFVDDEYEYEPAHTDNNSDDEAGEGPEPKVSRADYDIVEVIPVSDPNASTMSQRVVQYQAVLQLAQQAPQLYDLAQLHRQMLEVLGIRNVQKIIPVEDDVKPVDPISENMNVLNMKPVKAFIYQDHEAHIKVHMNLLQDPLLQQMMGQNPQAGAMMAAAQAHIAEHMAFAYRQRVEQAMGAALPPPDTILPENVEMEMSRLAAMASEIVLGQSKAEVAAQQAQQAARDPITQMQQRELAIKEAEVQRKQQKDITDAAAKADEIQLEKERLVMEAELKGLQVGADISKSRTDMQLRAQMEGIRTGLEVAREAKNQPQQQPKPPTGATE